MITVAAQDADNTGASKKVIFKNCAPFTNSINRINNTKVDDVHDIDVVMSIYNLKDYSDNYWNHLGFYVNIVDQP